MSGRVYHDRNHDFVFTTGDGAFDDSDLPKAWTVKLFAKTVGAPASRSGGRTDDVTGPTAWTGMYTFADVPAGNDYKVCVRGRRPDASS